MRRYRRGGFSRRPSSADEHHSSIERSRRLKPPLRYLAVLFFFTTLAHAEPPSPPGLENVGFDQRLGQQLPLGAVFRDESGRDITLRECFRGRPVLLTLVYYECPMLCTVTLNQLTRTLNALSESAGEQFDIITVSFNPRETPPLAADKKLTYLRAYRRASAGQGWHFLTGIEDSIRQLTQAAGFRYQWDPKHQVFAHAAGLMVITPAGKISRYFLGVDYPPTELRAALNDAAAGITGPEEPKTLLYCFQYDPASGKYSLIIARALQVMGGLTVAGIAGLIASLSLLRRPKEVAP